MQLIANFSSLAIVNLVHLLRATFSFVTNAMSRIGNSKSSIRRVKRSAVSEVQRSDAINRIWKPLALDSRLLLIFDPRRDTWPTTRDTGRQ